jgi:hypothetical protein
MKSGSSNDLVFIELFKVWRKTGAFLELNTLRRISLIKRANEVPIFGMRMMFGGPGSRPIWFQPDFPKTFSDDAFTT